ncbi:MAG TPA: TetR family transcriptional regulator [Pseudonocardiaceae bacterium]
MTDAQPAATPKSERTRAAIMTAALTLFRERGYQGTTMRDVAAAAGVSTGNAYYYFRSKEELVQGFYDQLTDEHAAAAEPVLAGTGVFGERLLGVLEAWLDVARPYHEFAGRFFAMAAQPDNPLSPFSPESSAARRTAVGVYERLLDGADVRPDPRLVPHLPELLWLHHLGIVLYWVHDSSPDQRRTRELAARTAPLVDRLVRLSRLRVLRPLTNQAVDLLSVVFTPRSPDHAAHTDR